MTIVHKEHRFNSALIIGGTGMLAEASAYVACNVRTTILASRHPEKLAKELHAVPLKLDWNVREPTIMVLRQNSNFDLIISWLHEDGAWLIPYLETMLVDHGRLIRVLGSSSHEFDCRKNLPARQQYVSLGWINCADGRRWLTHSEISNAVIKAIKTPEQRHIIAGSLS